MSILIGDSVNENLVKVVRDFFGIREIDSGGGVGVTRLEEDGVQDPFVIKDKGCLNRQDS